MPSASVSTLGWRMAKRSRSRRLWQQLGIPSTATSSRYQAGLRIPRRIRGSGIALRKLIRSRSVAGRAVSSKDRARFRRPQPMLSAPARVPVTHFKSALCEISLARFQWRYCHVRPHSSLGGRTPHEDYTETEPCSSRPKLTMSGEGLSDKRHPSHTLFLFTLSPTKYIPDHELYLAHLLEAYIKCKGSSAIAWTQSSVLRGSLFE
jgi:hypothetical protein